MPLPYDDFLSDTPEAAYYGLLQKLLAPKGQIKFMETQYKPTWDKYQGAIGGQALEGQMPDIDPLEWMKQYLSPGGGASQQWAGMSPTARGEQQGLYNPPTQFHPYQGRRGQVNALGSGFGGF